MKKVFSLLLAILLCVSLTGCGGGNKYTVQSENGTTAEYTVKELEDLQNDAIAFNNTVSGSVISGSGKITKIESSAPFAGQWADCDYYTVYINDELSVRIRAEFASSFSVGQQVSFEGRYYSLSAFGLELLPVNDSHDNPSPSVFA